MSQRNDVITLLPKKDKDCLYIKNFRSISLLTVDYKIFAKMLANRLKKCIYKLIHPDQSGFLRGEKLVVIFVLCMKLLITMILMIFQVLFYSLILRRHLIVSIIISCFKS